MTSRYHLPFGTGAARARWGGAALDNEASWTMHFGTEGLSATTIQTIFEEALLGNLMGLGPGMSQSYNFRGVDIALSQAVGEPIITEGTQNVTGAATNAVVPPNCCLLITKVTGLGGRRNRGRIFHPPITLNEDSVSDSGTILAAPLLNLQTMWDNLIDELVTAGVTPLVAHQYDPDLAQTPVAPTTVVDFVVNGRIATQRRRLR